MPSSGEKSVVEHESVCPSAVPNVLPLKKLQELGPTLRQSFSTAKPFPHVVLDNLFDPLFLAQIVEEFPRPDQIMWTRYEEQRQVKLASNRDETFGPAARLFLYHLNSAPFIDFLTAVTGIEGLIPDSHFEGGGMHQIERGGKLAIHADFNKHRTTGLDRRLNALLYLNEEWRDDYGGYFEMWDKSMQSCVKRVAPLFNRLLIFATTDFTFHGHPDPLNSPEGVTRKSLALYYYSNGRPSAELSGGHTSLFRARPGERFQLNADRGKALVRDLLPPALLRVIARTTRKAGMWRD